MISSSERMRRVMQYNGEVCGMCQQNIETTKHIIWECAFSQAVWTSIPSARRSMEDANQDFSLWNRSWFTNEIAKIDRDWTVKMANACWEIWKETLSQRF